MTNTNLKSFLNRPHINKNHTPRNYRVIEPEHLRLLRESPWTGPVLIEATGVPHFWMYHDSDDKVSGLQFYYGKDSFESLSCIIFGFLSRQSSIVYDIGGHCGIYSLLAASAGASEIHYFDILSSVTERFELNIKINNFKNSSKFMINKFGLSSCSGQIDFNYNAVKLPTGSSIENLPDTFSSTYARKGVTSVKTLDEYWADNDKHCVNLIKIDVEKHEEKILNGGKDFFSKYKPPILCEVLSTEQFYKLFSALIKFGYHCAYEVDDDKMLLRRIHKNMRDSNNDQYIHCGQYHNVLFTEHPLPESILNELEILIKQSPNSKFFNEHIRR